MVKAPPPLGLLSLAGYIRRKGHDVRVYDARAKRSSSGDFARILSDYRPEVVGVSLLSVEAEAGHDMARLVKKVLPGVCVVFGGPYPTSEPEDILGNTCVDAGVVGEGEEAFSELLLSLTDGGMPSGLPGLISRDNGGSGVVPRPPIQDVDSLPFPAYDLVDLGGYFKSTIGFSQNMFQIKKRALPLFTSRGCPYQCAYCHSIFGKAFRARSPESVLEEVRWLKKTFGVEEIHISDDIFNINARRASDICDGLAGEGGVLLAFPNGLRADMMEREMIRAMKRAGTFRITYAIESGSPAVQKRMKKFLNLDKAVRTISWTAEEGINTGGFFMFGFPDETRREMEDTVEFACRSLFHTASFFYLIPFPGTDSYEDALRRGYPPARIKEVIHNHLMDFHKPGINLSAVEDTELIRLKREATRRFYISPRRFVKTVRTLPQRPATWRHIFHNIRVVLRLISKQSVDD